MDSFELSKIGGAICVALLLIFVPKTIVQMREQSHKDEKAGYTLPAPAAETAAAPAASAEGGAAAPAGEAKPAATSGAGNAENGKANFAKCAACHTSQKGAAHSAGPNLWNISGRKAGTAEGFGGYSDAVKKKGAEGFVWDDANLLAWVQGDDKVIAGNKMIFPGIKDAAAAADLVAYIHTLSDNPK